MNGITSGAGPGLINASNSPFNFDVDGDGTNDFQFIINDANQQVLVQTLGSNTFVGVSNGNATPLSFGTPIDVTTAVASGTGVLQRSMDFGELDKFLSMKAGNEDATYSPDWVQQGPWPTDNTPAYLGVEFHATDGNHFGWIQLSAETLDTDPVPAGDINVIAYGFATNADTPIPAGATGDDPTAVPEPATLSLLALGSAGLAALRRRKAA